MGRPPFKSAPDSDRRAASHRLGGPPFRPIREVEVGPTPSIASMLLSARFEDRPGSFRVHFGVERAVRPVPSDDCFGSDPVRKEGLGEKGGH
eukprot:scaffold45_cov337-Pavlova_lutheri.AAC.12